MVLGPRTFAFPSPSLCVTLSLFFFFCFSFCLVYPMIIIGGTHSSATRQGIVLDYPPPLSPCRHCPLTAFLVSVSNERLWLWLSSKTMHQPCAFSCSFSSVSFNLGMVESGLKRRQGCRRSVSPNLTSRRQSYPVFSHRFVLGCSWLLLVVWGDVSYMLFVVRSLRRLAKKLTTAQQPWTYSLLRSVRSLLFHLL